MVSVFDVAKYILQKKGKMSTWKLQKLCYYSQAWHMAWTEQRLIEERFEAWANGPVCPELFRVHRGKFMITAQELPRGSADKINQDEIESIDIVLNSYGDREPYDLRELTHSGAPWKNARAGILEGAPSQNEITVDSMAAYYGSL